MSTKSIQDYVLFTSRADRLAHIDLATPCEDAYYLKTNQFGKKGDPVNNIGTQKKRIRYALREHLGLVGECNTKTHTCHLCNNNTKHGGKCQNVLHVYFGTAKENENDKPVSLRKGITKLPGHMNNQKKKCIHCGYIGNPGTIAQYHNNNCKHNKGKK